VQLEEPDRRQRAEADQHVRGPHGQALHLPGQAGEPLACLRLLDLDRAVVDMGGLRLLGDSGTPGNLIYRQAQLLDYSDSELDQLVVVAVKHPVRPVDAEPFVLREERAAVKPGAEQRLRRPEAGEVLLGPGASVVSKRQPENLFADQAQLLRVGRCATTL
jgi:hypothetical protein